METTTNRETIFAHIRVLVDKYRLMCLWYVSTDFYPETDEQAKWALERIQRYGDVEAFREAGRLKKCLLQSSNVESAG